MVIEEMLCEGAFGEAGGGGPLVKVVVGEGGGDRRGWRAKSCSVKAQLAKAQLAKRR